MTIFGIPPYLFHVIIRIMYSGYPSASFPCVEHAMRGGRGAVCPIYDERIPKEELQLGIGGRGRGAHIVVLRVMRRYQQSNYNSSHWLAVGDAFVKIAYYY